jgi:hypothetical protein
VFEQQKGAVVGPRRAQRTCSFREQNRTTFLSVASSPSDVLCNHRCPTIPDPSHPVAKFMNSLKGHEKAGPLIGVMKNSFKHHREVWEVAALRKMAIGVLVTMGTNIILSGDHDFGIDFTHFFTLLEEYDSSGDLDAAEFASTPTIRDVRLGGGERELIRFYSKRIICSCLKEKYSQAKQSQPKIMGRCTKCDGERERKSLMPSVRGKIAQYCCIECQVADWPKHKVVCNRKISVSDFELNTLVMGGLKIIA